MPCQIVDLDAFRAMRAAERSELISRFDDLECVKCGKVCRPSDVQPGPVVAYRCDGIGEDGRAHRPYGWRIDEAGDMLRGARGRRYWR